MSAAANAAGYLYAHGHLGVPDLNAQVDAARSMKSAPSPGQTKPVEQLRAPRIEYRKRRLYALPSAA
jgi:hypothetical protein